MQMFGQIESQVNSFFQRPRVLACTNLTAAEMQIKTTLLLRKMIHSISLNDVERNYVDDLFYQGGKDMYVQGMETRKGNTSINYIS